MSLSSPIIVEDTQSALRDAFTAMRLDGSSSKQSLIGTQHIPRKEELDPLVPGRRHSEVSQPPITAQLPSPVSERRPNLLELWADPNALYTMTCLEGQFVKVLGLNPARLTINDFERLYKEKFRELNEEIIGDNLGFVEAMQTYERDRQEYERHMRILKMQQKQHAEMHEHLQQQQDIFDPQYSSSAMSQFQGSYMYDSSSSLEPVADPANKHAQAQGPHSRVDMDHSSMRPHSQTHWSPTKLPPLETTQESSAMSGPRSSSWSSSVHYSPMSTERYLRPRGNSHADFSRLAMTDSTQVYYSTPSHGSSPSVSSTSSHFPNQ